MAAMDSEMQNKKRKAPVPADQFAKVKKIKQIALDKATQRPGVIGDTKLSSMQKRKKPVDYSLEREQPTGAAPSQLKATSRVGTCGIEKASKPFKASGATRKSLTDLTCSQAVKNTATKCSNLESAQFIEQKPLSGPDENHFLNQSEDEELEDRADTLLNVFESDDELEKDPEVNGSEVGLEISNIEQKIGNKAIATEKFTASDDFGVVYIGRIPHGFYEQEMRQYFSQFGEISKLRLSRNRRTGKSKHYAFIEFKSAAVAEIVSKTMDNYLLFGHILKCKMVAPQQVHENLWAGANRRFKKVPWSKIEARKLKQGLSEAYWAKRVNREQNRRTKKVAAMKMMDYAFEVPHLKSAKEAIEAKRLLVLETSSTEELQAIEAQDVMENTAEARAVEGAHEIRPLLTK